MYGALDIDEPLPAAWRSGGSSQQHIVVLAGLSREAREKRLRKYQLATVGFLVMAVSMGSSPRSTAAPCGSHSHQRR